MTERIKKESQIKVLQDMEHWLQTEGVEVDSTGEFIVPQENFYRICTTLFELRKEVEKDGEKDTG